MELQRKDSRRTSSLNEKKKKIEKQINFLKAIFWQFPEVFSQIPGQLHFASHLSLKENVFSVAGPCSSSPVYSKGTI